ncbi:RES domain-containing protein, partial [bacterium]|nr:RES domain-containing protein [bacterium]
MDDYGKQSTQRGSLLESQSLVADYLAMYPRATIDGILYKSVQRSSDDDDAIGANVVLFHKAATAADADVEGGTAEADLW